MLKKLSVPATTTLALLLVEVSSTKVEVISSSSSNEIFVITFSLVSITSSFASSAISLFINSNSSAEIESVVESVDIYPSLLDLCQLEAPYQLDGNSFTSLMHNESSSSERKAYSYFRNGISVRTSRYRLSKYFREEEPTIELYDHQLDPLETRNIAKEHGSVVDSLMPILLKGDTGLYELCMHKTCVYPG